MSVGRTVRHRRFAAVVAVAVVGSVSPPVLFPARASGASHDRIVVPDPAGRTPHVLDGEVKAIARVGERIVVGGSFTRVREAGRDAVLARSHLFAFDPGTGVVDAFAPPMDGRVEAVAAAPGGGAVFVGGRFDGLLAKLDLGSGRSVAGFGAKIVGSSVDDLAVSGGRLFVGGGFSAVNGAPRSSLAAVDAATGVVDPRLDVPFTQPRAGRLHVEKLDVTPDGDRLVAIGNFTRVAGQERHGLAVVDLSATPARLADWDTDVYRPACDPKFDFYMRGVDIAPGGGWFVVVTSGARSHPTHCDSAARFELGARGGGIQPTWVDHSGGDSFTEVGISGAAVYVGGHMRWMNNPFNKDTGIDARPGPGALPRLGIAALDPTTGLPFSWNPGRDPRGQGAFALVPTGDGLWVGGDTEYIGGQHRPRLALLPLAGGKEVGVPASPELPADLYSVGPELTRRRFDGSSAGPAVALSTGVDWSRARGAFVVGNTLYAGREDGRLLARPFDGAAVGEAREVPLRGLEGALPVARLSGLFYDRGRLYYTVAGDRRLRFRFFLPEGGGVVGALDHVVDSGGLDWSGVRGVTLASGRLYFADAAGNLRRVDFRGGHLQAGTVATVDGPGGGGGTRWGARGLFVFPGR